ncbi:aa3-type cytochrome c oxidase subunit IV [Candidatus Raskinella chloraquaticus]|uniref:aa3-type cytochrome c oxidase subunit IV n=1 Tax=Candidatus Raskinella chloraquaticus TaxID=1951219 RepID=UPI000A0E0EA4|nr:aa3-type cytochrome c oxidase subunit IV [Hyphomicrobiales bacterium]OQW82995.1 MAG: hypothetical protein BVN31_06765 [Proteobacteria bacterium ST_bin15]
MAENAGFENTKPGVSAMDYAEHERTYGLFLGLTKWVVILTSALLVAMAIFLV